MKTKVCVFLLSLFFLLTAPFSLGAQQAGNVKPEDVKKVYIIFKTHLDIGFTQLSSKVEQKYIDDFIPNAIKVAEELRNGVTGENYVWTTGSWLIWTYLAQASPDKVAELEKAIARGDIVWNGVPYTVESESMSRDLFETTLNASKELDKRFGKKTTGAKMTDVPGHTRGIIAPLSDAGITFLHIGCNPAVMTPDVPPLFRWRDSNGKGINVLYQGTYGSDILLPDGESVLSINLTGDNHGPHPVDAVKNIFDDLREKYPNAEVVSTSLNHVAGIIESNKASLPVLTSEIGDTWIYGFGSSPVRIARYRALSRLYSKWLKEGRLDMNSTVAVNFALRLGMIAEHTWGMDTKTHLQNWDKYDVDAFNAARNDPAFRLNEESWRELDANVDKAVAVLPEDLRAEANKELENIGKAAHLQFGGQGRQVADITSSGALPVSVNGIDMNIGTLAYQAYSSEDFDDFQDRYLRYRYGWAISDLGKPGLDKSKAKSAAVTPVVKNAMSSKGKDGRKISCELAFPGHESIDGRVYPENMYVEYFIPKSGNSIDVNVSLVNKPAVRLPEAYWFSFVPEHIVSVIAEKTGERVDVMDVVRGGNRQMHGIDNYIDIVTTAGTVRITSYDTFLAAIGERNGINFSKRLPDITGGVHFCLFNNLWGTNFSMWFEGSMTYRFRVEFLK